MAVAHRASFSHLSSDQKIEAITLREELNRRSVYNAQDTYQPYPKQSEFHGLGASVSERALGAGNQLGKSLTGS